MLFDKRTYADQLITNVDSNELHEAFADLISNADEAVVLEVLMKNNLIGPDAVIQALAPNMTLELIDENDRLNSQHTAYRNKLENINKHVVTIRDFSTDGPTVDLAEKIISSIKELKL